MFTAKSSIVASICEFTSRNTESIICPTGETIKIVIEDYVQHLSGYNFKLKFDPELLFSQRFQYQNRIASEFNTLYHWHPLMPDSFHIEEKNYNYKEFVFNTSVVTEHGIASLVESFSKQIAGRVRLCIFFPRNNYIKIDSDDILCITAFLLPFFFRLLVVGMSQDRLCMWLLSPSRPADKCVTSL